MGRGARCVERRGFPHAPLKVLSRKTVLAYFCISGVCRSRLLHINFSLEKKVLTQIKFWISKKWQKNRDARAPLNRKKPRCTVINDT